MGTLRLQRVSEMDERNERDVQGRPSDYGSRTLADTADGEPREERGTADSALTDDEDRSADSTTTNH